MSDQPTNTTPALSEFAASYKQRLASLSTKANEAADHLSKVFVYLQSLEPKLSQLEIQYDGCGDSGQVEDLTYFDAHGGILKIIDSHPLPDDIAQGRQHQIGCWVPDQGWKTSGDPINLSARLLIDELAWDLAYGKHPGFEINEGGFGTITIKGNLDYPNQVAVLLSHSERFVDTTVYGYEF